MAIGPRPKKATERGRGSRQTKALLRRHTITKGELKILKQIAMLETVAHPGHFIFILNAIRQASVRL